MMPAPVPPFTIERAGVSGGHCDCCGHESRCVAGFVIAKGEVAAAYWVRWTVGRLVEDGAAVDLVLGEWGDGTTGQHRFAVALLHRQQPDGSPSLMVVDATKPQVGDLADIGLKRADVIGTPLAAKVFAIVDAVYEQDGRFFV